MHVLPGLLAGNEKYLPELRRRTGAPATEKLKIVSFVIHEIHETRPLTRLS